LEVINLLPDEAKRQIKAGRTNVVLVRYIIFLIFAVLFLVAILVAVYLLLMSNKATAEQAIKVDSSKDTSYLSVQAQADSLRANLATSKSILDN
jgi:flagellar basal body-associated protein FliL